jgi:hypothetical protein
VSAITATGATVSWSASKAGTNPVSGYQIFETAPAQATVASTSSTSYALTGLKPGTSYTADTSPATNPNVTVYVNGTLIWGTGP